MKHVKCSVVLKPRHFSMEQQSTQRSRIVNRAGDRCLFDYSFYIDSNIHGRQSDSQINRHTYRQTMHADRDRNAVGL